MVHVNHVNHVNHVDKISKHPTRSWTYYTNISIRHEALVEQLLPRLVSKSCPCDRTTLISESAKLHLEIGSNNLFRLPFVNPPSSISYSPCIMVYAWTWATSNAQTLTLTQNDNAISSAIMLRNVLVTGLREVGFFNKETAWADVRIFISQTIRSPIRRQRISSLFPTHTSSGLDTDMVISRRNLGTLFLCG